MATLSSLLVHDEVVSVGVIEDALQRQVLEGGDVDTALLELDAVPENVLNAYRAASFGLAPTSREQLMQVDAEGLKAVPAEVARRFRVVPIGSEADRLVLAVAEPPEKAARDALRSELGRDVELRIAVEVRIEAALAEHYGLEIPGRMRLLAERLRGRDSGALPVVRVGAAESSASTPPLADDILRAFDSEPPPAPPKTPAAEPAPVQAVPVATAPVVSVAPVVRLGEAGRGPSAARPPVAEAPPPPGVHPAETLPSVRSASAPPTAPAFAAPPSSRPPTLPESSRPASAPTSPAFSTAGARGAPQVARPAPVRISARPISRPAGGRRSLMPLGPLSAEAARERIDAADDRDTVIEVFFGFARQYFECSALLALRDEQAIGVEARGLPGGVDIASVVVPVVKGSVLDETERSRLPRVADLSRDEDDLALVDALARREAQPAALVPVLIRQRVVFVLYGDRDGAFFKVEEIADLIELLPAVSRAFERIIRTRKVFAREARTRPRPVVAAPQPTPSFGPPLGTWGSASPAPLEPRQVATGAPDWPPRPEEAAPAGREAGPLPLTHVSQPFMRAAASRVAPERTLAPLGLSREPPPPPRFAGTSSRPAAESAAETHPTVKLPRQSAPLAAPQGRALSNRPPPGAGSYSAAPPPPETLRPMRAPADPVADGARRRGERPHRRGEEASHRPDTQPLRRSRPISPPVQQPVARELGPEAAPEREPHPPAVEPQRVDPALRDDPRDTVRQRPAPVRRRAEDGHSYSVKDVPSEVISVRPPPLVAGTEASGPADAQPPAVLVDAKPMPGGGGASPGLGAQTRPESSIIVELDSDLVGLVEELMRCGPDDEAPVLARIARLGEPVLPVLTQHFPGPLWFDRRQSHQRLPRGRDVSAIARAFAAFGGRADKYLITLLESKSLETRFYATLLAVDSLRPALLAALAERLFDTDAKIRLLVLEALGSYQHLPEFDAVLESLRTRAADAQSSLQMRMTAIDALAALRDVDSLELLIALAVHPDRQLSVPAHRALVTITAQDFGGSERKWLAWLKKHGDRYRAEWLIEGLMHSDEKVRAIAGRELQELSQVYFGYVAGAPKRERERAQRRYLDWWKNEGLPALEADDGERG